MSNSTPAPTVPVSTPFELLRAAAATFAPEPGATKRYPRAASRTPGHIVGAGAGNWATSAADHSDAPVAPVAPVMPAVIRVSAYPTAEAPAHVLALAGAEAGQMIAALASGAPPSIPGIPGAGRPLEGTSYVLHSLLGEGAMGEVFLGEHAALGRRVVIKLIRGHLVSRKDLVDRLRREARILARIRHPALVDIHDLGVAADGRTFFVMEWIAGTTLREVLQRRGVIDAPEACALLAEGLDGLEAAHVGGVVHRDVKPENLLVTTDGHMKVLDFGVAKVVDHADAGASHTGLGLVVGTPRYMAPEQARGALLSPATDVYAMGCVLFELLAGAPPFESVRADELLWHHVHTPAPTLERVAGRRFDPAIEDVIGRALRKDPAARYTRAAEMAEALRQLRDQLGGAGALDRVERFDPLAPSESRDPRDSSTSLPRPALAARTTRIEGKAGRAVTSSRGVAPVDPGWTQESGGLRRTASSGADAAVAAPSNGQGLSATGAARAAGATEQTEVVGGVGGAAESLGTRTSKGHDVEPIDSLGAAANTVPGRSPRWIPFVVTLALLGAALGAGVVALRDRERGSPPLSTFAPPSAVVGAVAAGPGAPSPVASFATAGAESPVRPPTPAVIEPAVGAQVARSRSRTAPPPSVASKANGARQVATAPRSITAHSVSSAVRSPDAPSPTIGDSPLDRARAALASGDLLGAEIHARQAVSSGGGVAARLLLADVLEREGKISAARDTLRKIVELDPANGVAKARLARLGL